jgi:hypothetical protein
MTADPKPESDLLESRRERALKFCDKKLKDYRRERTWNHWAFVGFRAVAIVLGAITPALILATLPKWVQALSAAIVTVATAMITIFQWREEWVRSSVTTQQLEFERQNFSLQTTPYAPSLGAEEALSLFMSRIESIIQADIAERSRGRLQGVGVGSSSTSTT